MGTRKRGEDCKNGGRDGLEILVQELVGIRLGDLEGACVASESCGV